MSFDFSSFPKDFLLGTSTASAQIETATEHTWKGVASMDNHIFENTIAHEKHWEEDIEYIVATSEVYRMSLDWSALQSAPLSDFDENTLNRYLKFIKTLTERNVKIMMVCHHFCEPIWFDKKGSWFDEKNHIYFYDFVQKIILHFSEYISYWNTFNEPNVYCFNSYFTGAFPPFEKNFFKSIKLLKILSKVHQKTYQIIKDKMPQTPISISMNTVLFEAENIFGKIPAFLSHHYFISKTADLFFPYCDFLGISYYARIPFRPFPITELFQPGELKKMNYTHDKMWQYYPKGLSIICKQLFSKFKKKIMITENGVCTDDDEFRIQAIQDYLHEIKKMNEEQNMIEAYIHWSTFDNFEWNLGPTYRFGLVNIDRSTMQRSWKKSGLYFQKLIEAKQKFSIK